MLFGQSLSNIELNFDMKTMSWTVGLACLLGACQANQMKIAGEVGELKENKIYLGEITNEYYGTFKAIDSAEIKDGRFTFCVDSVKPQMLFLGFRVREGGLIFAEPGNLNVKPGTLKEGEIRWQVDGGELNRKYDAFLNEKYVAGNKQVLDSLDELFYAARAKENREEMKRIKELSIPIYEASHQAEAQLTRDWVGQNKDNALGIYLYYSKLFVRKDFPELKDIETEREYLESFGLQAEQSPYKQKMEKQLDMYAGCAVGAMAPEISGVDTLGNPLKLSDFRGKYVIVDFWNSYCHWCREETPWLRKALDTFKDKNFTILGVSNDPQKELWLRAIQEDHSHWNHLLISKKDPVMNTYCIKAIPHIILVGPDGKILAKEMRHDELTDVPAKFIK